MAVGEHSGEKNTDDNDNLSMTKHSNNFIKKKNFRNCFIIDLNNDHTSVKLK